MATRTKTVFPPAEVPHLWAHQKQQEARGGHIFFNGRTIYSYGYHFPIATIDEKDTNVVWYTLREYSSQTSKDKHATRAAASHMRLIYVDVPPERADPRKDKVWQGEQLSAWVKKIKVIAANLDKARKPEIYIHQIEVQVAQMKEFLGYLKIKPSKMLRSLIENPTRERIVDFTTAEREAIARREKAAIAQRKREEHEAKVESIIYLDRWKAGEIHQTHKFDRHIGYTALRAMPADNLVETSLGIRIPIPVAHRYFDTVNRVLKELGGYVRYSNSKTDETIGMSLEMMGYKVERIDENGLQAGCHLIPHSEIEYIAKTLGW